jgi:hypothetical protein
MAYFILFLFVAYVAPLFFFREVEPYARSLPVSRKRPRRIPKKICCAHNRPTLNI